MNFRQLRKSWLILALYLVCGLALGVADPHFGRWLQQLDMRRGLATAASVNLLMSLLAIGLGVACPRVATAWLGAVCMTGGFLLGLAFVYPPAPLFHVVSPVLVLACLGYAVLGSLAALITRRTTSKSNYESHQSGWESR